LELIEVIFNNKMDYKEYDDLVDKTLFKKARPASAIGDGKKMHQKPKQTRP